MTSPSKSNTPLVNLTPNIAEPDEQIHRWVKTLLDDKETISLDRLIAFLAPDDPDAILILKGLLSSLPTINCDVPTWVKIASHKTFEGLGMDCVFQLKIDSNFSEVIEALGKTTSLIESILNSDLAETIPLSESHVAVFSPMAEGLKQLAAKSPPREAAAFFNARNDAQKLMDKVTQPTLRTKIFIMLVMNWSQIEKIRESGELKSTNDLHLWLTNPENLNCKLTIPPHTDSREIRKACETIGLTFNNQWRKTR